MRPIYILYILAFYVLFQFCWWSYLLIELNKDVFTYRIELANIKASDPAEGIKLRQDLINKMRHRQYMVAGEGIVFLSLLLWGSLMTYRSFKREFELARLQKNFLLSVTHEFKSPLAAIKLYLETLQRHDLDASKQQAFIKNALSDAERLNLLVENALMANLIDHDRTIFSFEEFNLTSTVLSLVKKYHSIPGFPEIKFDGTSDIKFYGDKNAISILLTNLIENAGKYSPKEETISITLKEEKEDIKLSVSDKGIGITDEEKEKIFWKFYRAGNEETRTTKGTGLGLYLSRFIARKHHGDIRVMDNEPKGAVFEVTLHRNKA
jgi:two-component system phosphate regulon sensor histidine kinase PhoR